MNLFEIQREIHECQKPVVDAETGEIVGWEIDIERLEQLEMDRQMKIRNIVCWIKNLRSDAAQLAEQEKTFAARKKARNNKADSLEGYLKAYLDGEKVVADEFMVNWRESKSSDVTDIKALPDKYKIPQDPKVDKRMLLADLKVAEKNGETIPGAQIVVGKSMSIK